jgi:hypothetical protein
LNKIQNKQNMKRLTYTKKTSLVLHTEDYSNAGLQQSDIMKAIEKIDGVWMVTEYPINSNVEVHIKSNYENYIKRVFYDIQLTLNSMLLELNCA